MNAKGMIRRITRAITSRPSMEFCWAGSMRCIGWRHFIAKVRERGMIDKDDDKNYSDVNIPGSWRLAAGCWCRIRAGSGKLEAGSWKLFTTCDHAPHHWRLRTADSDGDVAPWRGRLRGKPASGDRVADRADGLGGRAVCRARPDGKARAGHLAPRRANTGTRG